MVDPDEVPVPPGMVVPAFVPELLVEGLLDIPLGALAPGAVLSRSAPEPVPGPLLDADPAIPESVAPVPAPLPEPLPAEAAVPLPVPFADVPLPRVEEPGAPVPAPGDEESEDSGRSFLRSHPESAIAAPAIKESISKFLPANLMDFLAVIARS